MTWVQTLSWPGLDAYNSAARQTLFNPDTGMTEAFVKAHDRFKFYWILGAGHSVGVLSVSRAGLRHRPTRPWPRAPRF